MLELCLLLAVSLSEPVALPEAKRLYFEAIEGKGESLGRSVEILLNLSLQPPGNPVVTAYLGSARLLESARTLALWKKGKLVKQGLELLDKAVGSAPENLEVRFLRAVTTYRLPGWFGQGEQAEKDFAHIAPRAEAAAKAGELDRRLAAAALYFWGEIRERNSDIAGAKDAWMKAVRVGPESRAGKDAAKKLRKFGS